MIRSLAFCGFLSVLIVAGCNKYEPSFPKTYPVHGIVFLDGKPLTAGMVELKPSAGKGQECSGTVGPDGSFGVRTFANSGNDGACPGEYVALVRPLDGPEIADPKLVKGMPKIPTKYHSYDTSGLTVQIKEGDNQLPPLELKSSP